MKISRLFGILLMIMIFCMSGMTVFATEAATETVTSKPFLALGADLTDEQRATVLELMGLSEVDLANYDVVYVTNDMEHQYLDSYLDSSVIGTKSLSSVLVTQAEAGHGVLVTTKNISYCTTGMYRNALLTAGVEDADILVVGPTSISGTAGLIGALKAYEEMSGESISDATLDTALNELVTTSEIADSTGNSEDIEQLVAYIKAKMASGELQTDDDIKAAIEEGETKFGISLSDEEVQQIVDVMNKIKELGLDPNDLLSQAQDLYSKFGDDLFTNAENVIKTSISDSVSGYLSDLGQTISGKVNSFFKKLFS